MTARRRFGLLALALLWAGAAHAGRLDTVQVYSAAMQRSLPVVVAVPDAPGPHPAVYLLHGYGGGAFDWARRADLAALADRYGVVIVCPDGGAESWYLDSPRDPRSRFATFVGVEVPAFVEQAYEVHRTRAGRAITGLSMGGHGALMLALRHPDRYVAAASMSGGLDLRHDPSRWNLARHLGAYAQHPEAWGEHSVSVLAARADPSGLPALLIDCGVDDFFLDENRLVHRILLQRGIPHDYVERPGGHTWAYWTRVLPYHLAFFREQFEHALRQATTRTVD